MRSEETYPFSSKKVISGGGGAGGGKESLSDSTISPKIDLEREASESQRRTPPVALLSPCMLSLCKSMWYQ